MSDTAALARRVVEQMLQVDAFSRWMGIEVMEASAGRSVIRMQVRPEMVNGFGISHGGIVYSFADSAFAFAANSHGAVSVAVDCTINYPRAVHVGDVLTAVAVEQADTRKLAFCEVMVRNQRDEIVGIFRGTVYRTSKQHFPEDEK